jgi:predicted RNase H-like nuclease (RuvC/YqgF family)
MQKNIVFGVNEALAQESTKAKKKDSSAPRSEEFLALKEDIASLKQENTEFAAAVEEMRLQNEELKNKIDELISSSSSNTGKKKKKTSKRAGK